MPSYAELADVDPTTWLHQARDWDGLARELGERVARMQAAGARVDRTWSGADANAARARRDTLVGELTEAAGRATAVAEVLGRHAGTVMAAQQRAAAAVLSANPLTTLVTEDGMVLPSRALLASGLPLLPAGLALYLADARRISAEIERAVADAERSDAETVAELARLAPPGPEPPPPGSGALPPDGTDPAAVLAWWRALPPRERERLTGEDPDRIGETDGIPAADRDRANRLRLDAERVRLRRRRMRLAGRGGFDRWGVEAELDEIDAALAGIDELDRRLAAAPALLLGFDTDGSGRAVVATGDPDRSDNVVTYVPGVGAGLASAGTDLARSDSIVTAARAADPHSTTTAITWIGYHAPRDVADAADPEPARAAGSALARFQQGLRVTGRAHLTVVGHSYGSLVAGNAAATRTLQADELVLVGSAGTGTRQGVTDLGMDPSHVWATVAANDPINHVPGPPAVGTSAGTEPGRRLAHGLDPTDPAFGAQVFASAPGTLGPVRDTPGTPFDETSVSAAHSQYWDTGSPSLASMGRIAVGRPDVIR